MAEPLKNLYGPAIPTQIARMIAGAWKGFDQKNFLADCLKGYDSLELMPRGRRIASVLQKYLPADFPRAVDILIRSMGSLKNKQEAGAMTSFLYMPHAFFVAENGLDHFEASMKAQYEITQRFTAEFSIRPFLDKDPRQTLERLRQWALDPKEDIRRLVSEGTRPRLPWAPRLRAFQKDPSPVLALLELLKDDPSLYVRRSVANNLNDIGKDHPDILVKTAARWMKGADANRKWIIRHALRSLVKQGNVEALRILGFAPAGDVTIRKKKTAPAKVVQGAPVTISFELHNESNSDQRLMIDFRVHYVKSGGKTGIKVFKLKACHLAAGTSLSFTKKIQTKEMTTRKHYPGHHMIDLLINGKILPLGSFELVT